ncbi:MAG: tRNA guanosine(34) transglycosylase Tgt, partial [Sphingomonadales bacterium]
AKLGGLHQFMDWARPILTDSGGYQVMSLSKRRQITEQGVVFQSHLDGSEFNLTPEKSIEIQALLGSDIIMAFDECTPYPVSEKDAEVSMQLSMRWAGRSREAHVSGGVAGALFGIVQGSVFPEQRAESIARLRDIGFDGYAVGGLAVGEGQDQMFEVLDFTVPLMPTDRPRYLMGVGKPADIVGAVQRGIDIFDCVLPTRSGRTGQAFTRRGTVNMKNARHADDPRPIDAACSCPACSRFSRAYVNHLVRAGEILGAMLLTWHNITYYQDLMAGLRQAIREGRLDGFAQAFHSEYQNGDIEPV